MTCSGTIRMLVWVLGALIVSSEALVILEPPPLANITFDTPEFICLTNPKGVTGPVMDYAWINSTEYLYTIEGKILFFRAEAIRNLPIQQELFFFQISIFKPLAIIYTNDIAAEAGASEAVLDLPNVCANTSTLVTEISNVNGKVMTEYLRQYNDSIIVRIDLGDRNIWREHRRGGFIIGWQVIFGAISFVGSSLALAKLIGFCRATGPQLNIAQFCLVLLFIVRLIYIALDPLYSGLVFNASQAHMMITIHWPLAFITTLSISLYWQELLSASRVRVANFVQKLRIPFIVISLFIIAIEISSSSLRAVRAANLGVLTTITGVIYAVVMVGLSIFFFVAGVMVLKKLREGENVSTGGRRRQQLRKTTILVICSGVFNIIWIAGTLIAAIRSVFYIVRNYYTAWSLIFIGILGLSITQILIFRPPSEGASSSSDKTRSGGKKTAQSGTNNKADSIGARSTSDLDRNDSIQANAGSFAMLSGEV